MANLMLSYWYKLYTKQTKAEQALEREICKLGVRYRTQHIVMGARAILDFYLPDHSLVIEVDDPSHFRGPKIKKDRQRTERLAGLGLRVIRFSNEEVLKRVDSVIERIASVLGVQTASIPTSTKIKKLSAASRSPASLN